MTGKTSNESFILDMNEGLVSLPLLFLCLPQGDLFLNRKKEVKKEERKYEIMSPFQYRLFFFCKRKRILFSSLQK